MNKYYRLTKPLANRPGIPVGFIIGWNDWENGYTGELMHWFSVTEVENTDNWEVV